MRVDAWSCINVFGTEQAIASIIDDSCCGYTTTPDMTSLITSGQKLPQKPLKMPPQPASGGISWKMFMRGSPNFTLSWITGRQNLPDMTSLVASCQLQNAIKYCTNVVRTTGTARLAKCCMDIHANLFYSHTGHDVTSCFQSAYIEVRKQPKMPDSIVVMTL